MLLTLVPFVVLAAMILFLAVPTVRPLVRATTLNRLITVNDIGKTMVSHWYDDQVSLIGYAASSPEAQSWDVEAMRTRARLLDDGFEPLIAIVFADRDGTVVVDSAGGRPGASVAERDYFQRALDGQESVTQTIVARTNEKPTIVFAAPVRNVLGEIIGVVFGPIQDTEFIEPFVASVEGGDIETTVVDDQGIMITGNDAGQAIAPEFYLRTPEAPYINRNGKEVLGISSPVGNGWHVISEIDAAVPEAAFRRYNRILIGGLLICVLLGAGFATLTAMGVQKPIAGLVRYSRLIGSGRGEAEPTDRAMRWAPIELRYLQERLVEMSSTIAARQRELERNNAELEIVLKEKSMLVQEVQHRVRNNLATMESILSLQRGRLPEDSEAVQVLLDSESRVRSMAVLHRQLYETGSPAQIDLAAYLDALVITLRQGHGRPGVNIECSGDSQNVDVNLATAVGLIVTELVVNAYKYAFPNEGGTIAVMCRRETADSMTLTVRDDGVGIPDPDAVSKGLGTQLVRSLVEQIAGTMHVETSRGTETTVRFPLGQLLETRSNPLTHTRRASNDDL
jgi:two-component sensor histidine kinase